MQGERFNVIEKKRLSSENVMKCVPVLSILCFATLSACKTVSVDVPDRVSEPATDVANTPLETLNIKKVKIPQTLKDMKHPYAPLPKATTCQDIQQEVMDLNTFLGVDQDDPDFENDGGIGAGDLAKMLIPYGGPIRLLSGATSHQKAVLRAARLGAARRAYLKAHGEKMGCEYPAAPLN